MQFCGSLAARSLLLIALLFSSLNAYSIQPSPAQLDAFRNLSPQQQAQLAQQFGVSIPQQTSASPSVVAQTVSVMPVSHEEVREELRADEKINEGEDENKLRAFGYDLFAGEPTTFAPINDIPVSSDYILGIGDSLKVNLYGKESQFFELAIDQDGQAYIPELGPISLAGLSFEEAKEKIKSMVNQKMIGVKAAVSMGQLRSIRVFVLGEARVPGSYVVSSLSTMTNALVLSGGVSELGSLRNIQLKRKGELIQTLDVYDLLLNGDTSGDAQLKSGDVVFIPPVGPQVAIEGQVKRPGYYELSGVGSIADLLSYSGGMLASAYPQGAALTRISVEKDRELLNLDLTQGAVSQKTLQNGDRLQIPQILSKVENVVKITGHVERRETRRWQEGLRVSDVLPGIEYLKSDPDLNYALIKSYVMPERSLTVRAFSVLEALGSKGSEADPLLNDQDELLFFGLFESRKEEIDALVNELRMQAAIGKPSKEVVVAGNVRFPGIYPLVKGMSVGDLLSAAGGLTEKAYLSSAELNRTTIDRQQNRVQERQLLALSEKQSLATALQVRDVLTVKTIPEWAETKKVELRGEVKFPGIYPFHKSDSLKDVIERAGGLTEYAYVPGAVFTRVELKEQQAKQLQEMRTRLEADIAKESLVAANQATLDSTASQGAEDAQILLDKLKNTKPLGRLVIDLDKILSDDIDYQMVLKDGDELYVPDKNSSITVVGEVQLPVSQIYEMDLNYWDYIERSGGLTDKADEERIYIIKANGGVKIPETSNWFASANIELSPGDTIVVPLDADKIDQIVLWRDMSQIFYQIALGAAAVGSL